MTTWTHTFALLIEAVGSAILLGYAIAAGISPDPTSQFGAAQRRPTVRFAWSADCARATPRRLIPVPAP
ncbi:MAG: hypothetical protein AB7F35_15345 [Acetobacteraceae bacterium]